ncbi:MFS transporter [Aneurinibacillus migulanus]|uniref:MFS transporter n=1 Tax=Aneurinibacillus migulanus TaxID=47500 RepID=UPI002E1E11D8|nr:MFS transporter [Aneurinibacillus migulanus]MED4729959.1 MFS transporter [Aneurinibacillus migulanus]
MSNRLQISKQQRIGLGLVISVLFIDMLLYSLIIPVIPYFTEKFQPSSTMLGILFSSYAVALLLTTPFFGPLSDRFNPNILMLGGLVCLTVTMPLVVMSQAIWQVAGAMILVGASIGLSLSPTLSSLASIVDNEGSGSYGAAYALFNMFHAVSMIFGPLIGGVLTDVMPIPSAIIAVSIVILVFIGVLGRTLRTKKQQELRL